ncbi:BRO1-domain-containing protein [Cylindrobasidium torrendii FP15055 ss-10]|uniref:BRO domain-containing protein 1 n=1 Tax=Cylindrobasidium torrendii FP15055 ss-10 TaxID=1314674 RepID=A0A0D7B7Y5_9AGAR|nr:BRO1-domain-containing protein [Cylindrobasidium torrendii FP15055 ss-10]
MASTPSPMIYLPPKSTDEVDWTTPIRSLIAQSYGENPDNYANECAALQRCRQDAVRGAGSDGTARDLLYKYFGQLELLELRFSEIRVTFPWRDAFTAKLTTQTSIAFEKASVLYQIASTHSSIAASAPRTDPEGVKKAFGYFKSCAGMLTYINENFLHAPSTDLSKDVVQFLVALILAQATEVFFEKTASTPNPSAALQARVAAQTASMYTGLTEHVKEFMGKGIFDRNWVTLIQIKSKYYGSLAQFHRAAVDRAASKYGDALVRFNVADTLAKEAAKQAVSFSSGFTPTASPTLPADAGSTIVEKTKVHAAVAAEKRAEMARENDLIYNAVLPSADALPAIEKTAVAQPVPIQEVYGTETVQKAIGPDIFGRLIPLSVHESASVYSEEKAKVVRGEVEKADLAAVEVRSALDEMGIREGLRRVKAMVEGDAAEEIPLDVRQWREDIVTMERGESVHTLFRRLEQAKASVAQLLSDVNNELDGETRACEARRVKWGHRWTQDPGDTREYRQDVRAHRESFEAAGNSDAQVVAIWNRVQHDIMILTGPEEALEAMFATGQEQGSLLDLDNAEDEERERERVSALVREVEARMGKLNKIERERGEVLRDLKDKVQNDDVSHLLLLNRRNTGVEPALFASELEKFTPLRQRLDSIAALQTQTLNDVRQIWAQLRGVGGRAGAKGSHARSASTGGGGAWAKRWEERERGKEAGTRRFEAAREGYVNVRDGIGKGIQFYSALTDLVTTLRDAVKTWATQRKREGDAIEGGLGVEDRLGPQNGGSVSHAGSGGGGPPPRPPPPPSLANPLSPVSTGLERSMSGLSIGGNVPPAPQRQQSYGTPTPLGEFVPTQQHQQQYQSSSSAHGYASSPSQQRQQHPGYAATPPPPPPAPSQQYSGYQHQQQPQYPGQPQQQQYSGYNASPAPPSQSQYAGYSSPAPPSQYNSSPGPQRPTSMSLPPPPPPPSFSSAGSDPYASLGMLGGTPSAPPPPPPSAPPAQQYTGQQQYSQPPQQQQWTGGGAQPYGSQQHQYGAPQQPQQQQYTGPQYPGAPPQQGGWSQYGTPPPPPPAGQQGWYGGGR